MDLRLQASADNMKTKCKMAAMAVAFGLVCALCGQLGIFLIPFVCAPLSVVFVLERGKRGVLSIATPLLLVGIDALFNGIYSFSCLCAVGVSLLIFLSASTGFFTKGDSAVAAVIFVSLIAFLTVILYGCLLIGSLNFGDAIENYRSLVDTQRGEWVAIFEKYALSGADVSSYGLTPEMLSALYDSYVLSLYSAVVIVAFIIVGLCYKMFVFMLAPLVERRQELYGWRFSLSPIYGVAYIILLVMSLFGDGKDAFSIIVANLSNVLMVMLAYIGCLLTDAYFRMKSDGRRGGKLLIILSVLLFSSTAVIILSLLGVIACFMINRASGGTSGTENNRGGNDAR